MQSDEQLQQNFRDWFSRKNTDLETEFIPTTQLYLQALQEFSQSAQHFNFAQSSLINPYKFQIVKAYDFWDEDPRVIYKKDSHPIIIDLNESPLERLKPIKKDPDHNKFQNYLHEWYDLDQGLEYTIAGLNLIEGVKTSFPSCRGHTALPYPESPYFNLDLDFTSLSARILHHNLLTLPLIFPSYFFYLTREIQITYHLPQKDAATYTQFWQEVAELVNEFFTEKLIPQDKMVSTKLFTSEKYHYMMTPGDYD